MIDRAAAAAAAAPPPSSAPTAPRLVRGAVLGTAVFAGGLVVAHVDGVNGPPWHKWAWHRIEWHRLYAAMSLAGSLFFLAQFLLERRRWPRWAVLALLVIANVSLQMAALGSRDEPFHLRRLWGNVNSYQVNSYFPDALELARGAYPPGVRAWLADFPHRLPELHLHAQFKPPGLILFCLAWIKVLGTGYQSAMAVGLAIAVLAGLSVAGVYGMTRSLTGDPRAALAAAGYWALVPSLVGFLPMFDQIYPVLTCGLVTCWARALRGRRAWAWAVAFGALLALALFLSYVFLNLGLFLAGIAVLRLTTGGWRDLPRLTILSAIAVATVVALYAVLWLLTGFDPLATYRAIWALHVPQVHWMNRPYPRHIPWDWYDVTLGTGFMSLPLLIAFFARRPSTADRHGGRPLGALAVAQVIVVAPIGWLPGESARLLLPLFPMLMVPIGVELGRWPARWRAGAYGALFVVTTLVVQNMRFSP